MEIYKKSFLYADHNMMMLADILANGLVVSKSMIFHLLHVYNYNCDTPGLAFINAHCTIQTCMGKGMPCYSKGKEACHHVRYNVES